MLPLLRLQGNSRIDKTAPRRSLMAMVIPCCPSLTRDVSAMVHSRSWKKFRKKCPSWELACSGEEYVRWRKICTFCRVHELCRKNDLKPIGCWVFFQINKTLIRSENIENAIEVSCIRGWNWRFIWRKFSKNVFITSNQRPPGGKTVTGWQGARLSMGSS